MISDFLTIAQASQLIQKRELSPVELIDGCLKRIKRIDGRINSFIHVLEDNARAEALLAEREIASGHYKGLLHGIPIGLKDVYETAGIPTTCHSKIMMNHIPKADAHSVMRLKQAGAIIMGKLATYEFAFGGPSFDLPWPPALNPWDITRFTGGSSSGTGASIAAGLVLGGTASDTGGSIRTPAAYCGVTGIKPTFGLISRKGMIPLSFSLDHAGLMAWTAEDCAILLQSMAGFDPEDPVSINHPIPDYHSSLTGNVKGLRIGFLRHFYTTGAVANVLTCNAIDAAAKTFEELGCSVNEIHLSPLNDWTTCGNLIMMAEAYAIHEDNLRTRFMDYGEVFRGRMALAGLITSADYIQATRRRRELIEEFDRKIADFDVILTAVVRNEAPKIEMVGKFSIFEKPLLTMPFNVTGSPAISICCGYTETGLPLAMQIIGKRFDDVTVLRVADAYERCTPWRQRRPLI